MMWKISIFVCISLTCAAQKEEGVSADTDKPLLINKDGVWYYDGIQVKQENVFSFPSQPEPLKDEKEEKPSKWLIYCSAVPTIFVFLIAVVIIAVKNQYTNPNDLFDPDDTEGLIKHSMNQKEKKHKKERRNEEIYDEMLARFKEEKSKKQSMGGRKSSQIRIEGVAGRSPKSLARKHILIGKLNKEDFQPDGANSALGQLVQLSTHTFIGSSVIEVIKEEENHDEKQQLRNFIEQSRENLAEVIKILPDDVNAALLPEDLEEAFTNFERWEESLL